MNKYVPAALDVNKYMENAAAIIADDVNKHLMSKGYSFGPEVYREMTMQFLTRIMAMTVMNVMHYDRAPETADKKAAMDYTNEVMQEIKQEISMAVGTAFTHALSRFFGQPIDYYCEIKVAQEPPSKKVN